MPALTHLFFDTVYFPRNPWEVVRWWEARRPVYNLAVGTAGLVTLAMTAAVGMLPPIDGVVAIVAVYAVLANLCYCAGPLLDLLARRVGGPDYAPVGPTLFRYGFAFAIGLTLFPAAIATLFGRVRVALWLSRGLAG